MIDKTEREDFVAILQGHGYTEADFELSEHNDPLPAHGISPVTGTVTVKRMQSGIEHTYDCGHGTSWVIAFEKDLKANNY